MLIVVMISDGHFFSSYTNLMNENKLGDVKLWWNTPSSKYLVVEFKKIKAKDRTSILEDLSWYTVNPSGFTGFQL